MKYFIVTEPKNGEGINFNEVCVNLDQVREYFIPQFNYFLETEINFSNRWYPIPEEYVAGLLTSYHFNHYVKMIADTITFKTDISFNRCNTSKPYTMKAEEIIPVEWILEGIGVTNPDTGTYLGKIEDTIGEGEIYKVKWDGEEHDYLYVLPYNLYFNPKGIGYGKQVVKKIPTCCKIKTN